LLGSIVFALRALTPSLHNQSILLRQQPTFKGVQAENIYGFSPLLLVNVRSPVEVSYQNLKAIKEEKAPKC
jgi:hypothetical protein